MKRCIGTLLLVLGLQGCAHVTVDDDGTRRVTGFVRLTLPPAVADPGADALRVQAVGISIIRSPVGGATVVLGYGDATVASVRNDAKVSRTALLRTLEPQGER
jgi:hypothetical protein